MSPKQTNEERGILFVVVSFWIITNEVPRLSNLPFQQNFSRAAIKTLAFYQTKAASSQTNLQARLAVCSSKQRS